jgi:uncharacterized protein YcfJ
MKRAALLLIPALSMLVVAGPVEAKSKAFCRQYAEDVASRRANGGDVIAGTVLGAVGGALLGGAINGKKGARNGAIIGGVGGAVVGTAGTSEKYRRVYRRAYADCRAS